MTKWEKFLQKIKKINRVYYSPMVLLIYFISFNLLTVNYYFLVSNDHKATDQLIAQAIITMLSTGAGVLLPLLVNRNMDNEKDRRTLAFTLGLVWHELLYNKYILETLINNFKIGEILSLNGGDFILGLKVFNSQLKSSLGWSEKITFNSFIASQNSGSIKTFNSDELLNAIIQVYDGLRDVQLEFLRLSGNSQKNIELLSARSIAILNPGEELQIKNIITKDTENTMAILNNSMDKLDSALKILDTSLNKLDVKLNLEPLPNPVPNI